jgi:hypothetical protein
MARSRDRDSSFRPPVTCSAGSAATSGDNTWGLVAKALTAVGIALALLIGGLGLAVYLTRSEDYITDDNVLSEALSKALNTADRREPDVDLTQLARFAWDHVAIVDPRLEPADISRRLGHRFNGQLGPNTGVPLLFLEQGKVVHIADYRGPLTFAGPSDFTVLPRERAVLRVRDLTIRPAPAGAASGTLG